MLKFRNDPSSNLISIESFKGTKSKLERNRAYTVSKLDILNATNREGF